MLNDVNHIFYIIFLFLNRGVKLLNGMLATFASRALLWNERKINKEKLTARASVKMSGSLDLSSARKQLQDTLGDDMTAYAFFEISLHLRLDPLWLINVFIVTSVI